MPLTVQDFDLARAARIAEPGEWCSDCDPDADPWESPARFAACPRQRFRTRSPLPRWDTPYAESPWQALRLSCPQIARAIESSRSLLDLPDNWDDADSPPVDRSTWERAVAFLERNAKWVYERFGIPMDAPDITPGPSGSIDLHWDYPHYEMLINIPADGTQMAGFYGDDRGSNYITGTFHPAKMNEGLLLWLVKTK